MTHLLKVKALDTKYTVHQTHLEGKKKTIWAESHETYVNYLQKKQKNDYTLSNLCIPQSQNILTKI